MRRRGVRGSELDQQAAVARSDGLWRRYGRDGAAGGRPGLTVGNRHWRQFGQPGERNLQVGVSGAGGALRSAMLGAKRGIRGGGACGECLVDAMAPRGFGGGLGLHRAGVRGDGDNLECQAQQQQPADPAQPMRWQFHCTHKFSISSNHSELRCRPGGRTDAPSIKFAAVGRGSVTGDCAMTSMPTGDRAGVSHCRCAPALARGRRR